MFTSHVPYLLCYNVNYKICTFNKSLLDYSEFGVVFGKVQTRNVISIPDCNRVLQTSVPYNATIQMTGKDQTNLQTRLGSARCSQPHSEWSAWRNVATVKLWLAKRNRGGERLRDEPAAVPLRPVWISHCQMVSMPCRPNAELGAALAQFSCTCTGFVTRTNSPYMLDYAGPARF